MQHDVKPHELLKAARLNANLSQQALAERLGIHQTHLSQIERGECRPGLEPALEIEDFAGIPPRAWKAA